MSVGSFVRKTFASENYVKGIVLVEIFKHEK